MLSESESEVHDYQTGITKYGIPIRNIWLLLLYASDLYRAGYVQSTGTESAVDDTSELLAELLCYQVEQRLRNALTHAYVSRTETRTRVRGQIELLRTEQQQLLRQGKVMCTFEALTLNTARNCFIRGALEHLGHLVTNETLGKRCVQLAKQLLLRGITDPAPSLKIMRRERFGRHDKADQPMFFAAKLAHQLRIPIEQEGNQNLNNYHRDEHALRQLFEKAVAGFYAVRFAGTSWRVHPGKQLSWQIDEYSEGAPAIFPGMKTDIVLENLQGQRRIIIDTKFSTILKSGQFRSETLHSGYLYQLYTYLRSQERRDDPLSLASEGVLLHPSTGVDIDEFVVVQGHRMRFLTVDLGCDSTVFQRQLMEAIALYDV